MSSKKNMTTTEHAASILRMFEIEPAPLDRLVDAYFRRHRELGSRARREIADLAFDLARWRRRLDGILTASGIAKPSNLDRATLMIEEGDRVRDLGREGFAGSDAAFHSFPDFLYGMIREQYGDEGAAEIATALNRQQRPTVRINSLMIDRDCAIRGLADEGIVAEATSRSPFGARLPGRVSMGSIGLYANGSIEIQDESSQLAVILARPGPGEVVLDACAGAGGKSLMMAMLMENRGRVVATDINKRKLMELRKRAKRAGVKIVRTAEYSDMDSTGEDAGSFDLVFVDAPCSGTGTLRRAPDLRWRIDQVSIEAAVCKQKRIVEEYSRYVRPGGRLVYAICSVLREEGESVVESFLSRSDFEIEDTSDSFVKNGIEADGLVTDGGYLRADPRAGDWDGFFAARLRRG